MQSVKFGRDQTHKRTICRVHVNIELFHYDRFYQLLRFIVISERPIIENINY